MIAKGWKRAKLSGAITQLPPEDPFETLYELTGIVVIINCHQHTLLCIHLFLLHYGDTNR